MILFDLHTCCLYVRISCRQLHRGQLHSKTVISDLVDFLQRAQRWRFGVEIQTETPSNTPKLAKTKTRPIAMWCHNRCQASRIWGCAMILNSTVRPRFTAVVLLRSESGWSWTLRIGPGTLHGHKVAPITIMYTTIGGSTWHAVFFFALQFDHLFIQILTSDLHYQILWKEICQIRYFGFVVKSPLTFFPPTFQHGNLTISHFLSFSYWKWRNFTSFMVETYSLISIRLSVVKWWLCVYNLQPNASNCTRIALHTRPFLNAWRLAGQVVNIQVELVCCALLINLWIFLPIDPN